MSSIAVLSSPVSERFEDSRPDDFVDILRWRAARQGDDVAFRFLQNGAEETCALTYAELCTEVLRLAAALQERNLAGQRVLLVYPAGPDYFIAVLACLAARVIAVPLCPPMANRQQTRLETVALDADSQAVLTTSRVLAAAGSELERLAIPVLTTDALERPTASAWVRPPIESCSIAYLQYTSGSTLDPKGVIITHGNLLHNCRMIGSVADESAEHVAVSWLPLFHDMGLISAVFLPLYVGCPIIFMPTEAVVMRPVRWLEAITRYGGTISTAPNFAYDLCVARTTPAQREELDLSTWRLAFNGAERIQDRSLREFAASFAACGFRPQTFMPCFGLAEATLLVTSVRADETPVVRRFDREALANGIARPDDAAGIELVGCGGAHGGQDVIIVDPQSLRRCPPERVGEVWVAGPSVAAGYWNRPQVTAETFHARESVTGAGPYLRTGDLGFQSGGQLFITGRLKDLIIVAGRNVYPDDVEATVEAAHPAICKGGAVAFALTDGPQERLVVVAEIDRRARRTVEPAQIERAVRDAVAKHNNVAVAELLFVEPRSTPKTPSGKKQRSACRDAFISGAFAKEK